MMSKVLEGVRVLDLTRHLAGPYAATLLADVGAEVIRVEPPGGEEDRKSLGILIGENTHTYIARNRNKKAITLNMRSAYGKQIFEQLLKISDVVIEAYSMKERRKLGLSYETLSELNQRVILASLSAFGQEGSLAERVGFDTIVQAACGSMSITGFPEDPRPIKDQAAWVDYSTGIHLALGIMFALWQREKTGVGQQVDVSLFNSACNLMGLQGVFSEYLLYGIQRSKTGNTSVYSYADTFPTKNGWVYVQCARNGIWKRFTKAIGKEELANDTRFDTDQKRVKNRTVLDQTLKPWFVDKSTEKIVSLLTKHYVPCHKINSIGDMVSESHLKAQKMLLEVDFPDVGRVPVPGSVINLSASPININRAPMLGEHTDQILIELGYNKNQILNFKEQGIV